MNISQDLSDNSPMEILLFWVGFILSAMGAWILWNDLKIRQTAVEKMGQVVGFSTGPRGAKPVAPEAKPRYRVVLRFADLDGSEYFLIEGRGRHQPIYSMGEFIPIWVSQFKSHRVNIKRGGDKVLGTRLLVMGVALLALYKLLFFQSLSSFLSTHLLLILLGGGLLGVAHYFQFDWRSWFRVGQDGASLVPPQIVPVEDAKLIPWAHNVITPPPVVKKPLNLGFLKPLILALSFSSFFGASWYYLKQEDFLKTSRQARGRISNVREKSLQGIRVTSPVVIFYDQNRKLQSFQDSFWQTSSSFVRGQEVHVRYSFQSHPPQAQIDRGAFNHWKSLLLAGLGFFLYVGAQKFGRYWAHARSRKKSPIRIRQAG